MTVIANTKIESMKDGTIKKLWTYYMMSMKETVLINLIYKFASKISPHTPGIFILSHRRI